MNGGADIKRLHAGHASREGIQAALLAELGVQGPPNVVEARDGFMQAFAFGRSDKARPIALPPDAAFGITDCYIKPYACCRHIQPAVEALFGLMNDEKIDADEISRSTSRPIASPPSMRTPAGTTTPARSSASPT